MGIESSSSTFASTIVSEMAEGFIAPVDATVGEGCDALIYTRKFGLIVQELVNNCAEKDAQDLRVTVDVSYNAPDAYHLEVSDTVSYPPDKAIAIAKNLNSKNPKRDGKKSIREEGGEGLALCKRSFGLWGGTLIFKATEDHRIVAVADWSKTAFELQGKKS